MEKRAPSGYITCLDARRSWSLQHEQLELESAVAVLSLYKMRIRNGRVVIERDPTSSGQGRDQ